MMIKRVLALSCAFAIAGLLMTAGPVMAQSELRLGQPNHAIFEEKTCFSLATVAGERWSIESITGHAQATLEIGTGFNCAGGFTVLRSEAARRSFGGWWGIPTVTFTAGGGLYLLRVQTDGGPYSTGPYSLTPQRSRGRAGEARLSPGLASLTVSTPMGSASQKATGEQHAAGKVFSDCPSCPQMTVLPAGSFMMGSPDDEAGRNASEGPRHLVTLGSAFAMGTHEVTFDQYDSCVAEQACAAVQDAGWGRGARPVINVGYVDAQRYVAWLSKKTAQSYFLPSEAEWEYAARAGSETPWNTGTAIIASDANILDQYGKTVPVGSYPPNAFGLFDMHGNVAEWTQDCMDTGYLGAPNDGSAASGGDCNAKAILRGGGYLQLPDEVRSAARAVGSRQLSNSSTGFRVARAL